MQLASEEELIREKPAIEEEQDPFMPQLVEYTEEEIEIKAEIKEVSIEETNDTPIFFEISTAADQISTTTVLFDLTPSDETPANPSSLKQEINQQPETSNVTGPTNFPSSGSFLTKPSQIYVEETKSEEPQALQPENVLPTQDSLEDDETFIDLQLVEKETQNATEEPSVQPTQPIMKQSVEEPALQDEADEMLRRRANERLAKLRNISFNVNATDPNNEFETVPAYLRRNMDMKNQIADVETFYSNYSVKPTGNNQVELSTINTFLDGKKPD
jgi:cell division protein FtsZ